MDRNVPTVRLICRSDTDCQYWTCMLYGYVDISSYVRFLKHDRSRLTLNPSLVLEAPFCRTTTCKHSYFNRIVHLRNSVYKTAPPSSFATLSIFKNFLRQTYSYLRNSVFDLDMPCTWSLVRDMSQKLKFISCFD